MPKALDPLWRVPPFQMTAVTLSGATPITPGDLLGKPWVADFIYTSCGGPCPLLSGRMSKLQQVLPSQVRFISFAVDPDHDTIAVLQKYAARFRADPKRWFFVRGEKAALYKLVYDGFHMAMVEDALAPEGFRVTHSTKFVLVDQKGVVRQLYARVRRRQGIHSLLSSGKTKNLRDPA